MDRKRLPHLSIWDRLICKQWRDSLTAIGPKLAILGRNFTCRCHVAEVLLEEWSRSDELSAAHLVGGAHDFNLKETPCLSLQLCKINSIDSDLY
jgi:hypothetical protein